MGGFSTLQDIIEFEKTPLSDRNLPATTYDVFKQSAAQYGNDQAMRFFMQAEGTKYEKSVDFSFKDMLAEVTQTANMLNALGVGKDDTVSYILPNLPQTYFTLYGGEAAGIANPINPLLDGSVIAEIMNHANTKVLVTIGPFVKTDIWEKVAAIADDVPTLETILTVDMGQYLSGIARFVVKIMTRKQGKESIRAKVLDFDKTKAKHSRSGLDSGRSISPTDIAAYFHTGGTTGTPKLAMHYHENQVIDAWLAGNGVNNQKRGHNLLGLPLFHNYGAIAIGLGSWIHGAGTVVATPSGFRGDGVVPNFWKIMRHYDCNMFAAVPTLYTSLLNVPTDGIDTSFIELTTSGAAPLPVELDRQFREKFGIKILEGYGLTESTSVASVNPLLGESKVGSVGLRLPYQEWQTAVVEQGEFVRWCEVDEIGVVALRGPNIFPGYKDDFHNKGAFFDAGDGGDRWLNTGDMGRLDEDNYLWLTGRKKELIIRGGHNIDPKLIEEPMHEHPAVALAAAVGRPDARVGELPVCYVELKPDQTATVADLMKFAEENIGERAAVPKEIYILDAIPLTAVGKIFKPELNFAQIVDVFTKDLEGMDGIASFDVNAYGDKRLGRVADVSIKAASGSNAVDVEKVVRERLGLYPVYLDLKVE